MWQNRLLRKVPEEIENANDTPECFKALHFKIPIICQFDEIYFYQIFVKLSRAFKGKQDTKKIANPRRG